MAAARTVVIVNPRSQGGRLGTRWTDLQDVIGRAFPYDEAITTAAGDATRLAREALRAGADRVIAMGGDGTINEVVNGFFDEEGMALNPEAAFGVIPFGTGGDFRRTFDLPTETAAAAAVIAADVRQRIDVGRLTFVATGGGRAARMFANIASFGASGVVDRLVNASGKKLGRASFLWATARATLQYQNQRVQLTFDGADRVDLTINTVAIANGRFFGGGMKVAPGAEITDGAFDVVAIGDMSKLEMLANSRRIFSGSHLSLAKVSVRRARVVEAEPIDPYAVVELDIDGESPGRLPARFEVVPGGLWMIVPGAPAAAGGG